MGGDAELAPALEEAGFAVRSAPAPDTLATLAPEVDGVSVVVWRAGPERLQGFLDYIVDTPVRGFVIEAGPGADAVEVAGATHRMPVEVAPAAGLAEAVGRVLQ